MIAVIAGRTGGLKDRAAPRDLAALIPFQAPDNARFLTGRDYFVDAGRR